MKYKKTVSDLEKVAVKWWPKELEEAVAKTSVIPLLLKTQDQFISILSLSGNAPEQIFEVIEASAFPANLFLKHLCIVSDYGGELIQRLGREFSVIFPTLPQKELSFVFAGKPCKYTFKALPVKGLSNTKLKTDGAALAKPTILNDLAKDLIMLILHGGSSTVSEQASLEWTSPALIDT